MTFTEWYKEIHNDDWQQDYGLLYGFTSQMMENYEKWCEDNDHTEVWDG